MGPVSEISQIDEAEERALLKKQQDQRRLFVIVLVLFVVGLMLATILVLSQTGFIPLNDNDLFRST